MRRAPRRILIKELAEIARLPAVRELWGIEDEADERAFVKSAQGAALPYQSDCPGYAGEAFVLLGGYISCRPTVLIRGKDGFEMVEGEGEGGRPREDGGPTGRDEIVAFNAHHTGQLAEAIAMKHFTNRGFRITWKGDQNIHGIAFVAADENHAKYVEVRFSEGDVGADREIEPRAGEGSAAKADFITAHLLKTNPPAYSVDVANVYIDRSSKLARVRVVEGEIMS
ncbi:MAG TPA: hypothetical protein VGE76_09890 [Opitutaceae bacterium]